MRNFYRAAFFFAFLAVPLRAEILTIYSDKGMSGKNMLTWATETVPLVSTVTTPVPPEGFHSLSTKSNGFAGWGVFYSSTTPEDFSRFQNGYFIMWLYTNTSDLFVEIEYANHAKARWDLRGAIPAAYYNQWVQVPFPLTGVPLTNVFSPFEITAISTGTFIVDKVRYKTTPFNPNNVFELNYAVKNISDKTPATDLTFNTALPQQWVQSDQYIEVEIDPNTTSWGIQLYTDNTSAAANPKFSTTIPAGQPGSNPAGLVATDLTSRTLPMAWKIQAAVSTNTIAAGDPNSEFEPGFGWHYFLDRMTPEIVKEDTDAFVNGASYVTVADNKGIHYGPDPLEVGAENSPFNIHIQGNFLTAVTPRTYRSNQLILEYYTP